MLHPLGNTLLRTPEMFAQYHDNPKRKAKECFICNSESIGSESLLWRVVKNDFPYDAVASVHVMLTPIRHVGTYKELTLEEKEDLEVFKQTLEDAGHFDAIIENLTRGRTFMPHYHLHLIQWKRA